ncbi:MAG TPA: glycine oxidase ThiO [Gemmataceae bacterium]|nr:glycine oxidase ThiO [Gemmataceae bacterium]
MTERPDILILGGGVIGLTTAYFLAREGAGVAILDKGDFGQEASWAGAGILPPGNPAHARTPFDQLRAHSAALFPILSAELRERTGVDNGYLRCGGLEFLGEENGAAEQEWRGDGITFEHLGAAALARLEPALAPSLGSAFHLPDMAQLRNPRHLKALLAGCASWGVQLLPGCPVHAFGAQGARIASVRTAAGDLEADRFLLAMGAWSEPLLEQVGWRPGIRPVRGQIALLHTGAPLVRRILLWGARYLVPRPDGRVLIGSTEEDAGFEKRTTAVAISELLNLACKLVPALANAHLERCWAGLRPGSPDGLPFLGPVPGFDNLFVAAGHFRAGIQLSPATALVMKELLLGQPLTVPLDAFRLDRKS